MKCIQYWPELSKSMTYGHFAVENLEERHYACHSIRKFKVCHGKVMIIEKEYQDKPKPKKKKEKKNHALLCNKNSVIPLNNK